MSGVPGQVVADNGSQLGNVKDASSPDSGDSDRQTLDAKQLMMEEGERYTKYKADYMRRRSEQGSSISSGDEQRARSREGRPLIPPDEWSRSSEGRPLIPPDEYEYVLRRRMPDRQQQQVVGVTVPQDHQAQTRHKYRPEALMKTLPSDGRTRSIEHVEPRTLPQVLRQVKQSTQHKQVMKDPRKYNMASHPDIVSPKPQRESPPTQLTNPPVQSYNVSQTTNGPFAQQMHQCNSQARKQYHSTSTQFEHECNHDYWRSFTTKSTQMTPNQHVSSPDENGKRSSDKETVQIQRHERRIPDRRPDLVQLSHSSRAVKTSRNQKQYSDDWERPVSSSHSSQGHVKITNLAQKTSNVDYDRQTVSTSKTRDLMHEHMGVDSVPGPKRQSSDDRQTVSDKTTSEHSMDGDRPHVASDRFELYVRERRRDYMAQNSAEISSGGETCSSTGHVDGGWQRNHRVTPVEPVLSSPEDRKVTLSFPLSASNIGEIVTNRNPMASTALQRQTVPSKVCVSHSDDNSGEVAPTVASIKAALYGEVDLSLLQATRASQPRGENAFRTSAGSVTNGRPNCFQFVPARRCDDDSDDDVRLINYASFRDGPRRKRPNINDELTELEEAYERLDLDNEYLLDRATRRDYPRLMPTDNEWQSNVKRLSITNLKKLDEIQQQVENPSLEYAKRWLSSETGLTVSKNARDMTTITLPVPAASPPRGSRASSLPRKFGDDMAVRKYRRSNSGRTAGSHVTSPPTSYIGYSPSLTPAPSVDSISKRSQVDRARTPEVVVQRFGSEVDYLLDRTTNPVRFTRHASEADIYHDDVAYRQLRRDVTPVTCQPRLRQRSQSVERPVERQLLQERRNSVGVSSEGGRPFERNKSLSHGVASMVDLFSMRASLSAPNLSDKSVFSGQYDCRGDLVTDDPKYSKYALPPRTHQTPRIVKQRHEMRSRLRQANSVVTETAADASRGHRSPPDGALDSNETNKTKVSGVIESQQSVTDDVGRYKVQVTARKTPEQRAKPTTGKIEWCKLDDPLMSSNRCPAVPVDISGTFTSMPSSWTAPPGSAIAAALDYKMKAAELDRRLNQLKATLNQTTATPAGGIRTATPAEGIRISTLAEGIRISTPAEGIRISTPAEGIRTSTPTVGIRTATPTRGIRTATPTGGIRTATPTGGIHTATPTGGIHTATPAGGIHTATATGGIHTATATGGIHTATATGGIHTATPTGGIHTATPTGGIHTSTPAGGIRTATPAGGIHTAIPTGVIRITTPAGGIRTATPAEGIRTSTPTGGIRTSTPTGDIRITTPAGGIRTATPAEGIRTATPTGGIRITTPAGGIRTATPAGGLRTATPAGGIRTATPTGSIRTFTASDTRQLDPVVTETDCDTRTQMGLAPYTMSHSNNSYGESIYVPTRVDVVRQQPPTRQIEVAPASISATSVGPSDRCWGGVSPYGGDVYRRRQTNRNELSDGEMTDATDTTLDILVRRNVRSSSADTLDFSCSELDVASVTSCEEDLERLRELCRSACNTTSWTQPIGVFSGASFTSNKTKAVVTESVPTGVVMRTRTEEVVHRGSKVERTPSFKELVHSFEEQSSAFMRAPVRINSAAVAQCDT